MTNERVYGVTPRAGYSYRVLVCSERGSVMEVVCTYFTLSEVHARMLLSADMENFRKRGSKAELVANLGGTVASL